MQPPYQQNPQPGAPNNAAPPYPPVYPPQQAPYPPQQAPYPPGYAGYPQKPHPFVAPDQPKKTGQPRTLLYVMLAAVVLIAAVILVSRMIGSAKPSTAYVRLGTRGIRYTGDAIIVRNETVFGQEGVTQIDYIAEEGSAISRVSPVCTIYTSGFNVNELTKLQNYRNLIKEYHKTLLATSTTEDVRLSQMEQAVILYAKDMQALVQGASGNLLNQEQLMASAMSDRQYYLRQKYPDDQKLARLYDDEDTQLLRIENWTKNYTAAFDGIVSFYTDGYEPALNMNTYANFSPTDVRAMINGHIPTLQTTVSTRNMVSVYRLIRQNSWAVLMLCDDREKVPLEGQVYELLIESFDNTNVRATVESVSLSGGELLVRLIVDSAVDPVLYIRDCKVQLGENVQSLTVPTSAVIVQDGQKGVVIVQPEDNFFVPVTVIAEDGAVSHVIPLNSQHLYQGLQVLLFR